MTINENVDGDQEPTAEPITSEQDSESEDGSSSEEKESREETRFKEGQILRFVRVRFPGNSRSFPFLIGKREIVYGQKVMAMSDRGMALGYVNSFPYEVPFNKSMLPVRSISKVASEEDIQQDRESYIKQKEAENICNDLIEQHKLDMHLTHVEFTSFGKKAVFYFIAPSRVDFRDLVRDLVHKLKTRIELRQISVRDRSGSIGGIGPCGRELCCSSFLTKYGNVGIKMAKNQDLTLNFSKLNGVCGQLKCCLQYEDEVYKEKRSRLPRENDIVMTHTGERGKVLRLHLLTEQFEILTDRGIKKRYVADLYKESLNKEEANFPREFESVTDETHKVIGLEESEARKIEAFEEEVRTYKEKSKSFAEQTFEALFGEKSLGLSMPEVEEPDTDRPKHVVTPEEEEEIAYTPSEDEILEDDEDVTSFVDEEVIPTRLREERPQRGKEERPRRGQRSRQATARPEGQGGGGSRRGRDNRRGRQNNRRGQGGPQGGNRDQGRNRPPK